MKIPEIQRFRLARSILFIEYKSGKYIKSDDIRCKIVRNNCMKFNILKINGAGFLQKTKKGEYCRYSEYLKVSTKVLIEKNISKYIVLDIKFMHIISWCPFSGKKILRMIDVLAKMVYSLQMIDSSRFKSEINQINSKLKLS